jgi:DSF synthase
MTFIQDHKQIKRSFTAATPVPADAQGSASAARITHPFAADMGPLSTISPQAEVAGQHYAELDVSITDEDRAFWCFMKPPTRPSFSRQLLIDLAHMQQMIKKLFANGATPFDYFILGSRWPGVFNMGGDLNLFADKIRQRDREGLRQYAYACVDTGYANYSGYDNGIVTIALLQGDALGGGLESALSCDILIAERQAKFGLPEVLFNMFPGMGAYSFLSRRVGMTKAEDMMLGGRTYTAEEMLALGAIDMVVEPGEGIQAVRAHIARNRSRLLAMSAVYRSRRRVNPVTLAELRDVTDIWVDTALKITEQDLRRMCRIAAAQDRFRTRSPETAVARAG